MIEFDRFVQTIRKLRGPDGCPWDKRQTLDSLKKYSLEEAQELVEAIDSKNMEHVIEELGDVLLQVVLLSTIIEESRPNAIKEVITGINNKMIRRHPHVFSDSPKKNTLTEEDVIQQWHDIKQQEKAKKNGHRRLAELP